RGTEFLLSFTDLKVSFNSADWVVWSGQLVASAMLVCAAAAVPQRPTVFRNERKVDDMNSVSFYSRMLFNWIEDLLAKGWKTGHLEESDLPLLADEYSSKTLYHQFSAL